jgi:lipooligosaccharide transport system permease protein
VVGNLLFVAVRLAISGTVFVAVAVAFGALGVANGIAMLPVSILTGIGFAAAIQAFAATQRGDQGFTLLFRFVITPLFLFSGTFFPVDQLPEAIRWLPWLSPLWHGIDLARSIALGSVDPALALVHLAVLVGVVALGIPAGVILFRRRLLR